MDHRSKLYAGLGAFALAGAALTAGVSASGATTSVSDSATAVGLHARLNTLNNSGGHGHAHVWVHGTRARVDIDAFHLAWRRARAIERLASALGLLDPSGLAQVRAALPHLPDSAWMATPALPPGEPETVEGEAVTIGFEALGPELRRLEDGAAQALTVRPVEVADPAAVVRPRRSALDVAVRSAAARPQAARAALLAAGGALFGALLSRRRR